MKRSTSVLSAGQSRTWGQVMRTHHNRPTKVPLGVEARKALLADLAGRLVGLAALPVGLAALLVDLAALPVDQAGPLGDQADRLVGPEVHLADKKT